MGGQPGPLGITPSPVLLVDPSPAGQGGRRGTRWSCCAEPPRAARFLPRGNNVHVDAFLLQQEARHSPLPIPQRQHKHCMTKFTPTVHINPTLEGSPHTLQVTFGAHVNKFLCHCWSKPASRIYLKTGECENIARIANSVPSLYSRVTM